ncbi:MAG: NAD(P)-dependent oxidoreductase [Gammaproteobacteria bacterium]|nr:NAD(P)-dependent oxidoreductase [Gammaproteobacteria bacterium]
MTKWISSIGCAGAGMLGSAIMHRLVERGFTVNVWNRNHARLQPLVDAGATAVDTPGELVATSEIVLTCVTDGAAVERIVFAADGIASRGESDKLLIDMSTVDANHTRDLAERLRSACGMGWLDAPTSGGPPAALKGSMAVMVGGRPEDFERARPVWDALAGRCTRMGDNGAGQTTKMINQVLVACTFAMLGEACALAERAGIDAALLPHALEGGRADSYLLQEYLPRMVGAEFTVDGTFGIMTKDLEMIHDLAREVGASMPVTALVHQINRKMVADGYLDRDNSEIVKFFRGAGAQADLCSSSQ